MKYTQSILVACAGAAMLVSAAPHGSHHHAHNAASASGGAPPPAADDAGLSRRTSDSAGSEGSPTPMDSSAAGPKHPHHHHSQHHANGLEDHNIRRRSNPDLAGGATPAGAGHRGFWHHSHAGLVARDFDELLASRSHHAHGLSEPEPQPVARDFDNLLALRDLLDELEARSNYEDVLFPRSLELDDALEVRQSPFGTGQHPHHHRHHFGGAAMGGTTPSTLAGRSFYDFEVDELD